MWAQLISMRLKAGKDSELGKLFEQLHAIEQPGTGLIRSLAMRDQKDPTRVYTLVLFESEERPALGNRTIGERRDWPRPER
jgi:heme-degrading monooxygenase HmoA